MKPHAEKVARAAGWVPAEEQGVVLRPSTDAERKAGHLNPVVYAHSWGEACEIDGIPPFGRYHVSLSYSTMATSPKEALRMALDAIRHAYAEVELGDDSSRVVLDGAVSELVPEVAR